MRTLYFDCFAGASGNMILGALLELGLDREELKKEIAKLNIPDFDLIIERVDRSGISAVHVEVMVPHEHKHRHLSDIEEIVNASDLTNSVKTRSKLIFERLAQAEAKIHGIDIQQVHFHEVGAMDAIVDVVGACIGFDMLGIERFACSKIHVGGGFVKMAHGNFPVPPPAVVELLKGVPIYSTDIEGELITPTAAAIISTVCDSYGVIPDMLVEYTAYGAGKRTYTDFPNVLRLMLGESEHDKVSASSAGNEPSTIRDRLVLLETNLDDISPQILGYTMERAFAQGALDCWFTPIQMKKDRLATLISILCKPQDKSILAELLYRETSTLGVRVREVERECLPREFVKVETQFGTMDLKIARLGDEIVNVMPEYDQVKELATKANVPFWVVREAALEKFNVQRTISPLAATSK